MRLKGCACCAPRLVAPRVADERWRGKWFGQQRFAAVAQEACSLRNQIGGWQDGHATIANLRIGSVALNAGRQVQVAQARYQLHVQRGIGVHGICNGSEETAESGVVNNGGAPRSEIGYVNVNVAQGDGSAKVEAHRQ